MYNPPTADIKQTLMSLNLLVLHMSGGPPSVEDAYPLPDDIHVNEDGFIPPEDLVAHFDADHDGNVTAEEFVEVSNYDKLDKNLERIKNRRSGRKGIFRGPEGLTFLGGLAYGLVFSGSYLRCHQDY